MEVWLSIVYWLFSHCLPGFRYACLTGVVTRDFSPALGRQRRADLCEFTAALGYIVSSRPIRPTRFIIESLKFNIK